MSEREETVSEREECGYCARTESEGHAPTCPDRATSPATPTWTDHLRYHKEEPCDCEPPEPDEKAAYQALEGRI